MGHQGRGHGSGKPLPVEIRSEPAVERPVDKLDGDAAFDGKPQGSARTIRHDHRDRQFRLHHRSQQRPRTRDKDPERTDTSSSSRIR